MVVPYYPRYHDYHAPRSMPRARSRACRAPAPCARARTVPPRPATRARRPHPERISATGPPARGRTGRGGSRAAAGSCPRRRGGGRASRTSRAHAPIALEGRGTPLRLSGRGASPSTPRPVSCARWPTGYSAVATSASSRSSPRHSARKLSKIDQSRRLVAVRGRSGELEVLAQVKAARLCRRSGSRASSTAEADGAQSAMDLPRAVLGVDDQHPPGLDLDAGDLAAAGGHASPRAPVARGFCRASPGLRTGSACRAPIRPGRASPAARGSVFQQAPGVELAELGWVGQVHRFSLPG